MREKQTYRKSNNKNHDKKVAEEKYKRKKNIHSFPFSIRRQQPKATTKKRTGARALTSTALCILLLSLDTHRESEQERHSQTNVFTYSKLVPFKPFSWVVITYCFCFSIFVFSAAFFSPSPAPLLLILWSQLTVVGAIYYEHFSSHDIISFFLV